MSDEAVLRSRSTTRRPAPGPALEYDVIRSPNRSNHMNVHQLVSSVSRCLLSMGSLMLAAGLQPPVHASGVDLSKFRRIEPQCIAALGAPGAPSGHGAP